MDLSDLLQQFGGGISAQAPEGVDVEHHFDQVSGMVSKESLAGGIAEAFRSDQTPPFASMLGGLFGNAGGGQQQAGVLNILLSVAGPILMQKMAGGGGGGGMGDVLGAVMGASHGAGSAGGGRIEDLLGSVLGGAGAGGGGGLGGLLGQMMGGGDGMRQITEEEAAQISPEQVQALAEEVHRHDPSVIDRLSEMYADRPDLMRSLGSDALSLALSKIAQQSR